MAVLDFVCISKDRVCTETLKHYPSPFITSASVYKYNVLTAFRYHGFLKSLVDYSQKSNDPSFESPSNVLMSMRMCNKIID